MKKTVTAAPAAAFAIAVLLITNCGRVGPDAPPDTTPPTINATNPRNGEKDVPLNGSIAITFSEEMDRSTINTQTLSLTCSGINVSGSATYSAKTAHFTPDADLNPNSEHIVTISIGVKDAAGNAMVAPYFYTFSTGTAPDITPPRVISVTPLDSPGGVSIAAPITATFSEPMRTSTITVSTFRISGAGKTVAGTVTYDDAHNVAAFAPATNAIAYGTVYTGTIVSGVSGVKDAAGNALATNYTWTFTTVPAPDTKPDPFSFTALNDVATGTQFTSNPVTVTGINAPAAISIAGGAYSTNAGPYTSAPGTVTNAQTVTVRLTSSPNFGTTTTAVLTIGQVSGSFTVTTQAADTTPEPFSFAALIDVATSTEFTSNPVTVTGINAAATISITGGTYSVDGGAYTAAAGTVTNGRTVTVRQTSSPNSGTTTTAELTIGEVTGAFSVTTAADIPAPALGVSAPLTEAVRE